MALPPGTRVGPYEIVAPLGAGGMGEVYRARDTRLHRDVALKILRSMLEDDAGRRARFGREAQALASLNHPNIAQIHGLEEDASGVQVLVLELVEGATLAERIAHHIIYPSVKGTFERYSGRPSTDPIAIRDYLIMWRKDLGRTVDYLQTRRDIDRSKIAYMGHSMGAEIAPMLLAMEPRVSVALLLSGGLAPFFGKLPEINAINFLPRVRIPVLMVNGA